MELNIFFLNSRYNSSFSLPITIIIILTFSFSLFSFTVPVCASFLLNPMKPKKLPSPNPFKFCTEASAFFSLRKRNTVSKTWMTSVLIASPSSHAPASFVLSLSFKVHPYNVPDSWTSPLLSHNSVPQHTGPWAHVCKPPSPEIQAPTISIHLLPQDPDDGHSLDPSRTWLGNRSVQNWKGVQEC